MDADVTCLQDRAGVMDAAMNYVARSFVPRRIFGQSIDFVLRLQNSFSAPPNFYLAINDPEGKEGESGGEDAGGQSGCDGQEVLKELPWVELKGAWFQILGSVGLWNY
ncbi:hypothetical protein NE857_01830 [Nocardiopsis exhalans]|uniref:Uncharacterized protein n=1 Tax=Nocardiopsis exhalans TaxID=163604 RepID=A0ABY5DBI0_9ACTN|nr:hypothetical protein [Nocardiopsis exhalans]USY20428.1 hypothetical protein NE857_01830 [Nocardiopsis exhalans]